MINKGAFEKLDGLKVTSEDWWQALGYIDDSGNNTMKQLMDPFPPKKKKK